MSLFVIIQFDISCYGSSEAQTELMLGRVTEGGTIVRHNLQRPADFLIDDSSGNN